MITAELRHRQVRTYVLTRNTMQTANGMSKGYENKSPQATRTVGSENGKAGRTVERGTASQIK